MKQPDETFVALDARYLLFPRSISEQARNFLISMVSSDGRPMGSGQAYPPAADTAAWIAIKHQVNARMTQMLAPLTATLRSSCEAIDMAGVTVQRATPHGGPARADRAFLDMHGGALIFCENEFCRFGARKQADNLGVTVYSVDYRNPPEHPYPAALDDCVTVYRELLNRYAPENIIIGGLSAGGNLAAATILRARDEDLPLPVAAILLSPEVDLTESGDSFQVLPGIDVAYPTSLMPINLLYSGGHDLSHPFLSPLFGDFTKGFPPTFLQTGTRDMFLSNTVRFHRALRQAKIETELHVFEAMPHGGFQGAPEDLELAA